jgi:SRSO17 transposase
LHFVAESQWDDHAVRRTAAQYAIAAIGQRESIATWIIDDTGFLKQGTHSVGVQRQYTGSAGKIANCQIGVSLSVATQSTHLPVDFELYLPESWASDAHKRREGGVPKDVVFRTKPELALEMVRRALRDNVPQGVLLADAAYGNSSAFRAAVRAEGLDYAVGIESTTKVWPVVARRGQAKSVGELAMALGIRRYRKVTWRDGTRKPLWSWFAACRVVVCHDDGTAVDEREELWLLIEWPPNENEPTKFTLSTLPKRTSVKTLALTTKERWRNERVYEDLKGELGLDHFEGRRFRGWHHHVSVALCCYAFIVAEQARSFPPSGVRAGRIGSQRSTPRTPLRRFIHHDTLGDHASDLTLAAQVPALPSRTPHARRANKGRLYAEAGKSDPVVLVGPSQRMVCVPIFYGLAPPESEPPTSQPVKVWPASAVAVAVTVLRRALVTIEHQAKHVDEDAAVLPVVDFVGSIETRPRFELDRFSVIADRFYF